LANYNGLTLTFAELSQMVRVAFRLGTYILIAIVLAGVWLIKDRDIEWLLAYLMFSVPAILIIYAWSGQGFRGVPLLPVIALQQMLVFTAPILAETSATALVSNSLMLKSGVVMLVFLSASTLAGPWLLIPEPMNVVLGGIWASPKDAILQIVCWPYQSCCLRSLQSSKSVCARVFYTISCPVRWFLPHRF
jgi:hypothetical protein